MTTKLPSPDTVIELSMPNSHPADSPGAAMRPHSQRRQGSSAARRLVASGIFAALAFGLAGCGTGNDAATDSWDFIAVEPAAAPMYFAEVEASADAFGATGNAGGSVTAAPLSPLSANREIITWGWATLVASDPAAVASDVARLAEQAGGFVQARNETRATEHDAGWAELTLRLPPSEVNPFIDALYQFGEIADVNINREDVTAQGRDLDARIRALEVSTARLTELMENAGRVTDLLQVEQELSFRQMELDSLRSQRNDLTERVSLSTLNVRIVADDSAVASRQPTPQGFVDGIETGWDSFVAAWRNISFGLAAALPWLVLTGLLGTALWFAAVRPRRRRRASRSNSSPVLAADDTPTATT